MKRIILTYTLAFSLLSAYAGEGGSPPLKNTDKSLLIDYVDPSIGTTNFGTTNPGAICPNGMMSVVPFNVMGSSENTYDKDARWWSTPYEYTNCFFTGYAHVNLSGVGCPELGSLLLMPTTGELNVDYKEYGSKYKDEQASPGYYSNYLTKYNVKTEVSATPRSGIARFTFPKGKSHILLNLGEGLTNESGAMLRRVSDSEVEGVKLLGTFCYNPQAVFPIYFVLRVKKNPSATGYWKKQRPMMGVEAEWDKDQGKYKLYTRYGKEIAGDDIGTYFSFDTEEGEQVEVQMGVSFVSIENARLNLDREQAEVGIHLEDEVITLLQRPFEAHDIGCAQAQLTRTLQDMETVGKLIGLQLLNDVCSSVRTTVIDNKDVEFLLQAKNGTDDFLYIFLLVVCRNDYDTVTHNVLI